MRKVVIVTDSNATVPAPLVQELGIRVVPLILTFDGRSLRDGVDITPGELYRWQRTANQLPKTSAVPIEEFKTIYREIAQQGADVVSIHLSGALSSTISNATIAAQEVHETTIRIVDSGTAAMAQGLVVIAAARAAAAGQDAGSVEALAKSLSSKVTLLAALGTLKYLRMGGRISGVAATAGDFIQIKPIVQIKDGRVQMFARPRTMNRAIEMMIAEMRRRVDKKRVHCAVVQADEPELARQLRDRLSTQFDCVEMYVTELTPVMGAHAGPGVLGVVFYPE